MDLGKSAHWHNIGTFWLTVVIVLLMVWPLATAHINQQQPAPESDRTQLADDQKPRPSGIEGLIMPWIMPSILALALLGGGALQLAAARRSNRTKNTGGKTSPAIDGGGGDDNLKQVEYIHESLPIKKPNGTLVIHSATWFVTDDARCYIDAAPHLRKHIKESLVDTIDIALVNKNLGGDPRDETHKRLKLVYSYGETGVRQEIIKDERDPLVLPEMPDEIQKRLSHLEEGRDQALQTVEQLQRVVREKEDAVATLSVDLSATQRSIEDLRRKANTPVVMVSWDKESPLDSKELKRSIETFRQIGLPEDAARFAAVGRDGAPRSGVPAFRLLYSGGDDPLQNVTISPLTRDKYKAEFEKLPFLEKGKPAYLVPNVSIQGNQNTQGEFRDLFEFPEFPFEGVLRFSLVGINKGNPFEIKYRAEHLCVHPWTITVFLDASLEEH